MTLAVPTPPLLAITDRSRSVRPLPFVVQHLLEGGCRWISLREKDLTFRERRALLSEILAIARPFGARVTVHGDVVAALETGADGVHLSSVADLKLVRGKIAVDENFQTSIPGVFAGGDCIVSGEDLTVQSVEDGKRAAIAADRYVRGA